MVRASLELDHMRPVSDFAGKLRGQNPDKQTTKLRAAFNASNKTSNGYSLNDILHVGPTLQLDFVLLILRLRLFRYVYNCDISHLCTDYSLRSVNFGVKCAPYLAIRTLLQMVDDSES